MKFQDLVVLLPCQSIEDFSLQRDAEDAEELLSAYSALWHPALLVSAQGVPRWVGADAPPLETANHLIIVPQSCHVQLPDGWLDETRQKEDCLLIDGLRHRPEMVAAALEHLDGGPGQVDPELARDFLALGFGHLLVELLTRQLRYMANLDEVRFSSETIGAAEAAMKGEVESAREQLRSAYEQLTEAREYFYPVDAYLIDLTLVASTTLGQTLRDQVASAEATNLLISGADVARMAAEAPQTLSAVREGIEKGTVSLIGGGFDDRPLPLLPMEAVLDHLRRGLAAYREHLGARPKTFARRRFGLTPVLPQLLPLLGFEAAFHFTLDDGRFPSGDQSKVRWEGYGGSAIEAMARLPQDVAGSDTFLGLPEQLGDALDLDHTATAVLAHWPGQSSPWYDDLKRMLAYSRVFGRFVTADLYFEETHMAGQESRYKADQYRSPYLRQDVAAGRPDPISRWVRYYQQRARADAIAALDCLAQMALGPAAPPQDSQPLVHAVDDLTSSEAADTQAFHKQLDEQLDAALQQSAARLADAVGASSAGQSDGGLLLLNPCSFSRRHRVDDDRFPRPSAVDVPAMGFAWVGPDAEGSESSPTKQPEAAPRRRWWHRQKPEPPMVEENVLRNEFFELSLDGTTGAIHSLHDYRHRENRFSQQLALRMPQPRRGPIDDEGDDQDYSVMASEGLEVVDAGPTTAAICCRGRLLDRQGRRLAGYRQTARVRRGSRVLELEIELDPDQQPGPNPWESYYAARFAWSDATSDVLQSVCQLACPSDATRLESPHFVDVVAEKTRTTILCGGLPYHRRFGLRKLDTLLVVGGETSRRFRIGIGIDLPNPVPAAIDWLAPELVLSGRKCPSGGASGWLLHLDARNVIVTACEPVIEDDRLAGFRARLLETEGRPSEATLRCFRPVDSARRVDFGQLPSSELPTEGDRIRIDVRPHQFTQIEGRFEA